MFEQRSERFIGGPLKQPNRWANRTTANLRPIETCRRRYPRLRRTGNRTRQQSRQTQGRQKAPRSPSFPRKLSNLQFATPLPKTRKLLHKSANKPGRRLMQRLHLDLAVAQDELRIAREMQQIAIVCQPSGFRAMPLKGVFV